MLEEASCPTPSKSNIESRHSDIEPWKSRLQTWKGVIFWYLKYCKISLLLVLEMTNEISISLSPCSTGISFFSLLSLVMSNIHPPSPHWNPKGCLLSTSETSLAPLKPWTCGPEVVSNQLSCAIRRKSGSKAVYPDSWKLKRRGVAFGESTVSQTLLKQRGATEKTQFAFDLAYIWLFEKFKSAWVVTVERLLNVFLLGGCVWSVGQRR